MVVAPTPPADAAAVLPQLGVYIVINALILRTVPGAADMPTLAFSMALDADSWTWSWSATVHRSAEALAQPGAIVEAVVNGAPYRLVIERVARADEFPTRRIRVSGRGLAAVLAAPAAPQMHYAVGETQTAQQLAVAILTDTVAPPGWALDWGIDDWLVPAGAWTFSGSAMDALVDIAGAAGAIVQPHPTAKTLRILPRYPAMPWALATALPDVEIAGDAAQVVAREQVQRPAYDRVFVGGVSMGVFGPVTRAGTAGNVLAQQVVHPLITAPAAQRQRGAAVLADTGAQTHLQLSLQVRPETGVILPGQILRFVDGAQTYLGYTRSVQLDWAQPALRQNVGVECHVV